MKILLVHNKYKQAGGEDAVFRSESKLLKKNGHEVEEMLFDNKYIDSKIDQLLCGIQAIYNFTSARIIQKIINEFHPDVIHVHNFTPILSPSVFFVANRNNTPIILTLHNYRLLCPSATLFYNDSIYEKSIRSLFPFDAILKGVYRKSIFQTAIIVFVTFIHTILGTWRNRVDKYITLTQFAKSKFKNSRLAIADEKLVVKPNFVECHVGNQYERENYFLYVGRLTEEKGIRTLLNASLAHDFKLVIIGDGDLRKLVEETAEIDRNITYLGFQKPESVLHYLKSCKALIFPSIWYEGFPMTILEAFSTRTIVLASRIGGMVEIIQDKINGRHFEVGNSKDMIAKIIDISEHPEQSKKIAENGYNTYLENYTPEKNYVQLTNIYYRAIAERKEKEKATSKVTELAYN